MQTGKRLIVALALFWVSLVGAQAEGDQQLIVEMTAEKIVITTDEQGNDVAHRETPQMLLPGEEVVYTLTYRNSHPDEADDIVITNPIDPSLRYESGTALGEDTTPLFSIDGGASFAPAEELRVVNSDGTERTAGPDDYTHIRWIRLRPLESGNLGHVSFTARVR